MKFTLNRIANSELNGTGTAVDETHDYCSENDRSKLLSEKLMGESLLTISIKHHLTNIPLTLLTEKNCVLLNSVQEWLLGFF